MIDIVKKGTLVAKWLQGKKLTPKQEKRAEKEYKKIIDEHIDNYNKENNRGKVFLGNCFECNANMAPDGNHL